MTNRTDQHWIRELKQNDEAAITDLWQQLFVWAETLAQRKGQGADVGRDGAVAAYRRIMQRGIYQYSFQGPFLGFCRRIVVNEVYRRMTPEPTLTNIDDPTLTLPSVTDTEPKAEPATVFARLQPCLDALKSRERELLTLLYFDEKAPQLVAEMVGISRTHVNVIACRVRTKLKDCLSELGYASSADLLSL